MKLTAIARYVIRKSGQSVVGDLEELGFNMEDFWALTQEILGEFNDHIPIERQTHVYVTSFIMSPKPKHVSSVVPTRRPAISLDLNRVDIPLEVLPYEYIPSTGRLAIGSVHGPWNVTAHYDREYTIEYNADGALIDVDIENINYDDGEFMDLMVANFMIQVGRNRRAFTLEEFPLTTDAAELVQEGLDLLQNAGIDLIAKNDWSAGFAA